MALPVFSRGDVRNVARLLGLPGLRYQIVGVISGLLLFVAETGFAYGLQAFLLAIGVMRLEIAALPRWVPHATLSGVLVFVTGFGVLRGFLQWLQTFLNYAASETQRARNRVRIAQWVFRSQTVSSAETMSLFNEHIASTGECVTGFQRLSVVLTTAGLLWCYLLYLSPSATLSATTVLVFIGLLGVRMDRLVASLGKVVMSENERMQQRLLTTIKNLLLLQVYGTRAAEEKKLEGNISVYHAHALQFVKLLGFKFIFPQMIGVLMISVITLIAQRTGQIAPSLLVTYFYIFVRFSQQISEAFSSMSNISFHWPKLAHLAAWWERRSSLLAGIHSETPATTDRFDAPIGWSLRGATFGYDGGRSLALKRIDLDIRPGTMAVVTGPSGAGKSTLIFMMLGLFEPTEGSVGLLEADGKIGPISGQRQRLLNSVGFVGPENFIIEGTVLDNLTYGLDRSPSSDQVRAALERAECQFVFDMPKGVDHPLTEQGQGLSAGQKQRLSLARALLRRPKVLILDEATANLDLATELKLVETLRQLKGEITILAATHREALLKVADQRIELQPVE